MSSYDLLLFLFFLTPDLGYFSLVVEERFNSSWVTFKNNANSTTEAASIWILKT